MQEGERRDLSLKFLIFHFPFSLLCFLPLLFLLAACNQIQPPPAEPFYAQKVEPPPVQEFRWSNGKIPKSFDPAFSAAAPETDIVRAIYEGLTDIDPKTLQPVPAIAAKWAVSEDNKMWTFYLRRDAHWSNGETITAQDFARSWKRLVKLGDRVPQRDLFKNIVGMDTKNFLPVFADREIDALSRSKEANQSAIEKKPGDKVRIVSKQKKKSKHKNPPSVTAADADDNFGVKAVNDYTLQVSLDQPDPNFPSLVAHTVFRPVYADDYDSVNGELNAGVVTSGAFEIASAAPDGVALERSANYWNVKNVRLEKVRFVPMETAENALAAYRAGEIDAVTNADFEPLAIKLLAPYDDFRQTTHGALNFYEFNLNHQPFDDRRVREALATAIDRERLTGDEMDGVTEPALNFSPFDAKAKLPPEDVATAQKLLADAGYESGKNFPTIKLLVNRNNVQQRIARAVARMWKKNLNVETEIIVKDPADFEAALQNGEFDIVRRGMVLPTADETANMLALFPPDSGAAVESDEKKPRPAEVPSDKILTEKRAESKLDFGQNDNSAAKNEEPKTASPDAAKKDLILTEQEALDILPAIPLYFPTSYSLVKPYVRGFDINALDTPSLKNVTIDRDWQPSNQKIISEGND